MTGKKSSSKAIIIVLAVVFVGLLAGLFITQPKPPVTAQDAAVEAVTPMSETAATEAVPSAAPIDVAAALSDRVLGNTSAPLRISEHSSFTCSHCGQFHKETFEQVKTNYIDTGKAYLVFSDFPLNAPALKASMLARCLPQDRYFEFVQMLYVRQEEWAYSPEFIEWLLMRAKEYGMNEDTFNACVNNKELEEGIKARMAAATEQWKIGSTPSFVLNNKTVISGAYPYESFSKTLDAELTPPAAPEAAPAEAPAAAPVAETPPPAPAPQE
jgi:protein-disulfide isomerase